MASIEKRKTAEGLVTYRVKIRVKGAPLQTASFERITDAKKWAQQTEVAIRERRFFKSNLASKYTLAELIDRYFQSVLSRSPKKLRNQAKQLLWWKEQLGCYLLADITPQMIVEKRDELETSTTKLGQKRTPATINRYLAALSHVFTIGINEWGWMELNPVLKVTKLKEPRGRVRFLSDEERKNLLYACQKSHNPYLYIIVTLALSTGARKMEILSLKWSNIHFTRNVIILDETKNNERRALPLVGHTLTILQAHAKNNNVMSDLVFPGKNPLVPIDIVTAWEMALKRANILNFRFHDLRHSAASYLAMNGASLAEIAEVLGHKTFQMVKRYTHLSQAHVSKVVARMNESIFS